MKKHIICRYKNGSLLFSTAEGYHVKKAYKILEMFNQKRLVAVCEPCGPNHFRIVGRMNLYYDPFVHGQMTWEEVLYRMTSTMDELEKRLVPYISTEIRGCNMTYYATQ